ncbi:hypothetical protein DSO57_1011394 [Entomophthora muscae]|uniref:Uncharacterized protein n=2 Tax=Entomophthora muscae TaxID=34485 RepID=A0ACC2UFZ6_9FUNG|nr:hypothetical protein DSO57_1037663 [Entomophthora muscae]KAJ9085692.1 hypothetical protein DSO57_1011394 [Entomophthora muscae]
MYSADKAMKSSVIFNCLDAEPQTIIIPRLPENGCTFANVSRALMEKFSSEEALNNLKMNFVEGGINKAVPPLSPPHSLLPEDPRTTPTPSHFSDMPAYPQISDHNSLLAAVTIHTTNSATGLSDPAAQPTLCYPDQEDIREDQLHRVLAINALTQSQRVRKEPLLAPEAQYTVALPYTEQLALPSKEVTH